MSASESGGIDDSFSAYRRAVYVLIIPHYGKAGGKADFWRDTRR